MLDSAPGSVDASDRLQPDGPRWRRWARAGAVRGPRFWVRYSPALFGAVFYLLLPRVRQRIIANLRRILGRRGRFLEQRDALRTFVNYAHCLAEALALGRPEARAAMVADAGRHPDLEVVLQRSNRGFILATAHLGPWDAAAGLLAQRQGRPVTLVMQREAAAEAMLLHDQVRRDAGVEIAHVGSDPLGALPLARRLDGGGVIAVQMDRVPATMRDCRVELHGAPFRLPAGVFKLAAFCEVPIVPVFCSRDGFFRYSVTWGRPIRVASKQRVSIDTAAGAFAEQLEAATGKTPTQWFHFSED